MTVVRRVSANFVVSLPIVTPENTEYKVAISYLGMKLVPRTCINLDALELKVHPSSRTYSRMNVARLARVVKTQGGADQSARRRARQHVEYAAGARPVFSLLLTTAVVYS